MADPVRDFALDDSGDMAVANGDRTTVAAAAAVAQAVKVKVRIFLSEIFLNQAIGVDYLNKILIKAPDPNVVRDEIRARLASIADVTEVVGAQLIQNADRSASIAYQIRTKYSQTPVTDTVTVEV